MGLNRGLQKYVQNSTVGLRFSRGAINNNLPQCAQMRLVRGEVKSGNSSGLLEAQQWPDYNFAKAVVEPVVFGNPNVVVYPTKLLKIMI